MHTNCIDMSMSMFRLNAYTVLRIIINETPLHLDLSLVKIQSYKYVCIEYSCTEVI